jgi:16S rRNA (guanine1207-N2)-methyltransferase
MPADAREARLLLRHLDGFSAKAPLVVLPPDAIIGPGVSDRLGGVPVTCFTTDWSVHRQSADDGTARSLFAAWYDPSPAQHDAAIVFLPRGKAHAAMTLAMTARAVRPGAAVWVLGEIRSGIKSAPPLVAEHLGPVATSESGSHAVLLKAARDTRTAPERGLADWAVTYPCPVGDRVLKAASLPGVFSHGELDAGTALLLGELDPPQGAAVLDFGCGSGVLGAALRLTRPDCTVTLADASALALAATRMTLAANGLSDDRVVPCDVFEGLDGTWDLIVSNPPFHDGVATDTRVTEAFIAAARDRLNPGGRLHLVANRFLKYLPLLAKTFKRVKVTKQTTVYRVIEATRGPKR